MPADVFISYKKEDRALTEMLEAALKAHQLEVWWDRELRAGQKFRQEIEERLQTAGAVVVIWTERSILSDFVCDEANAAKDSGKLIPVVFSGDVRPPFGFREIQALSLSGWEGDPQDPRIQALVAQVDHARRGRIGAAASGVGSAVVDAVNRRAGGRKATANLISSLQFIDFLGLPLYRLLAGVLVIASLVTAFWLVPAVLHDGAPGVWPLVFAAASVAVLAARGMYQVATVMRGRYSRQFFDSPFSFWTCLAAILAATLYALFGVPMSQISIWGVLEAMPIYFFCVLFILMGMRLVGVAFGKLLSRL